MCLVSDNLTNEVVLKAFFFFNSHRFTDRQQFIDSQWEGTLKASVLWLGSRYCTNRIGSNSIWYLNSCKALTSVLELH